MELPEEELPKNSESRTTPGKVKGSCGVGGPLSSKTRISFCHGGTPSLVLIPHCLQYIPKSQISIIHIPLSGISREYFSSLTLGLMKPMVGLDPST